MSKLSHSNPAFDGVLVHCEHCDEPFDDATANVECFEVMDALVCEDCAGDYLAKWWARR